MWSSRPSRAAVCSPAVAVDRGVGPAGWACHLPGSPPAGLPRPRPDRRRGLLVSIEAIAVLSSFSTSASEPLAGDRPAPNRPLVLWRAKRDCCSVVNPAARAGLLLRASSIDADAWATSLRPPGNSEVSGQIPVRTRTQGQSGRSDRPANRPNHARYPSPRTHFDGCCRR